MSRRADCYDNAPMESFFHTLKTELVHHQHYATREEARRDIFAYIEGFYNRTRRHSAIGYLSPIEMELKALNPVHFFGMIDIDPEVDRPMIQRVTLPRLAKGPLCLPLRPYEVEERGKVLELPKHLVEGHDDSTFDRLDRNSSNERRFPSVSSCAELPMITTHFGWNAVRSYLS